MQPPYNKSNTPMILRTTIVRLFSLGVAAVLAANTSGFSQETTPPAATLPVERAITDTQGRAMQVTVLSKDTGSIKVRRADGKEFDIALDKLSETDRAFLANAEVKKPHRIEFTGGLVTYGRHLIFRNKEGIIAIEINATPGKNTDVTDKCVYAIAYAIRHLNKTGEFVTIEKGTARDIVGAASRSNRTIACKFFKFDWSASGETEGHVYLKTLPEDTEFYSEQLETLEKFDSQIDPAKWVKLTK